MSPRWARVASCPREPVSSLCPSRRVGAPGRAARRRLDGLLRRAVPVGASSAAEVNGGTISSDEVFTLLDAAGRTEGSSAQQSAVKGAGMNDTFKMNGFTEILGGLIRQQVIDDALDDRGIEVTDANRKAARQEIDAQLQEPAVGQGRPRPRRLGGRHESVPAGADRGGEQDRSRRAREGAAGRLRAAQGRLRPGLPRARCSAPARQTPVRSRPGWTAATTSPRWPRRSRPRARARRTRATSGVAR